MQQLTQNLKDGKMQLLEVPFPALKKGHVLVRNHFSVISAGTEGKTVKDARLGYIGKAKARKEEVKKVIDIAKQQGVAKTYEMVMNKLEAPSALGYSSAGVVVEVSPEIKNIKVGDHVACGGAGAVHAEVVSVAKNLCVKVDKEVDLQHAAFTTIGAIAMQGVRQAELQLGENCVVIGLGLVGQLTMQLLKAAGVNTVGMDIDSSQVELAKKQGFTAFDNNDTLQETVQQLTNGHGTDTVIITAATSSEVPVNNAGELCRKKGKVVIVGAVPTGFKRKHYYRKELDLRMSSSYGPGRYDLNYEETGIDYPIGYVRWTENRNMQAFVQLLKQNQLNIQPLLTHQFDFKNSPDAYQLIVDKRETYCGITLDYETEKELQKTTKVSNTKVQPSPLNVGFIGAGSFAQNFLLPNMGKANLVGVATSRPNNARNVADKFGFNYCTGNADEIIADSTISTIFIATRHDIHAEYVLKALRAKKNVFVEKPLCLTIEELDEIEKEATNAGVHLMVGFNRRFSPHILQLKEKLTANIPVAINYRINAGVVPSDHWIHNPQIGGGRVIGEVCHFIDLATHIAGGKISNLYSNILNDGKNLNDTVAVQLSFENGSVANISYFSNGSKKLPKEYLEVFSAGKVFVIDDFKTMITYGDKETKNKLSTQDKGHANQLATFLAAIEKGHLTPIPLEESVAAMRTTFKV